GAGRGAVLLGPVGRLEVALPLWCVHGVLHQTATQPRPLGPSYLTQMSELPGEPVAVLDLARRLGVEHTLPILERKLVVVEREGARIALCVDDVRDPEELLAAEVTPRERLGGSQHGA